MTIIRPDSKPAFWWVVPWAYARTLHRAANALRALSDKQDDTIALQASIIDEKDRMLEQHREHIRYLEIEAKTDHDRWIRTLEALDELRKKGGSQ